MTQITYPSEVVPGPPRLALDMPEGWVQVWAPDTLVAIRDAAEGAGHFLANVVVRFSQRPAPFGPDEIHAELSEYVAQRREGQIGGWQHLEVGGREFVGADLAFVDGEAGAVGQVHWFTTQRSTDVLDVIQVIGSYALTRREPDYGTIVRIVESLRINP